MPSNLVIYVDFDSTLYHTALFSDQLRKRLSKKTGLPAEEIKADGRAFFFHPYLGGYEYEKHMAKYGLDPAEMWSLLEETCKTNFLFTDSIDFIKALRADGFDPKILSFGEKRFQSIKIQAMLPLLSSGGRDIEVVIVDKKKNQHIAALHNGQHGVLIDDVPDQDLPAGFTEIHLNRSQALQTPLIKDNVITISDLAQARKIINNISF